MSPTGSSADASLWPVFIRVLGAFSVSKIGRAVEMRAGGKAELLLSELALRPELGVGRDELVATIWPATDRDLGGHSLDTLVSALHRDFRDVLAGDAPVVRITGRYRLNADVGVDVAAFEAAALAGDRRRREGDWDAAKADYARAAGLYRGDLSVGSDVRHVIERERLRVRYLSVQTTLAERLFEEGDYQGVIVRGLELLAQDACREDVHRLLMRCYVRLGERAQALRQFQLCRTLLRSEFDAEPEPSTVALYDQVRLFPAEV